MRRAGRRCSRSSTAASVFVAPPSTPSTKRASRSARAAAAARPAARRGGALHRGILSGSPARARIARDGDARDLPAAPLRRGHVRVVLPARRARRTSRSGCGFATPSTSAPDSAPRGSVWCTVFDARRGRPFMHKLSGERPARSRTGGWIAIGEHASIGPGRAEGSLRRRALVAALQLRRARTASPLARLALPGAAAAHEAHEPGAGGAASTASSSCRARADRAAPAGPGWSATTGAPSTPSAGSGCTGSPSTRRPSAWLDVALGRLRVAGRMTPWVANGALSLDGRRHRIGGLGARGTRVARERTRVHARLAGEGGLTLRGAASRYPPDAAAGWRYGDPRGGEHDVINCSIAVARADASRCRPRRAAQTLAQRPRRRVRARACASATTGSRSRRSPTAELQGRLGPVAEARRPGRRGEAGPVAGRVRERRLHAPDRRRETSVCR